MTSMPTRSPARAGKRPLLEPEYPERSPRSHGLSWSGLVADEFGQTDPGDRHDKGEASLCSGEAA